MPWYLGSEMKSPGKIFQSFPDFLDLQKLFYTAVIERFEKSGFLICFQFRCAVRASGGIDRNFALAIGADLGSRRCFRFVFLFFKFIFCTVDHFDDAEENQGDQKKIDDGGQELTVIQGNRAAQRNAQRIQVRTAGKTDDRVQNVINKRINNRCEGAADDDTNRHVHDISAAYEFLEFIEKFHAVYLPQNGMYLSKILNKV